MDDGNDLLMGGGIKSATFPDKGATVSGVIIRDPEQRQQRDYDDGTPLTWDDGAPRMSVVVVLQTNDRDPGVEEDTGERSLWIKIPGSMREAVRDAVRASGSDKLAKGGTLTVRYVADGEPQRNRAGKLGKPPKLYKAHYQPPNSGSAALMAGDGATAAQAWPPPAAPTLAGGPNPFPQPELHPAYVQAMQAAQTAAPPAATGLPWPEGQAPWLQGAGGQPVAAQQFAAGVPATTPQPSTVAVAPPPPAPPGVDPAQWPGMWAQMNEAQRGQVLAAMANVPPF